MVQRVFKRSMNGTELHLVQRPSAFTTTIQRVFICGAHSTGKSTLVQEVSKRIPTIHVQSEVARKIIKDLQLSRDDFDPQINPTRFEELQERIIEAQCNLEKQNALLGRSYIADRGPDPLIYAMMYLGPEKTMRLLSLPTTRQCIDRYKQSLVFVIKPFKECVNDDHVRLVPKMEELIQFTEILEDFLCKVGVNYTLIDVLDIEERVNIVLDKIGRVFNIPES